jgi:beta-lactamase regulating signal transducer with metallopeptidase domain
MTTFSLQEFATTSLLMSLLIAVFLPLRPLLQRMIGSRWLCVLWLALLARLLVPVPLESRWSLFNRWQGHAAPAAAVEPVTIKVKAPDDAAAKSGPATEVVPKAEAIAPSRPALPLEALLGGLWLAGFATSLCILAWRWNQTRRLAAQTRAVTDERLSHIFSSIPQKWRRNAELRMTDAIQVPTLAGTLRPQIWMPRSWPGQFTDEELRNVLLHELGHARRADLAVQWLFAIAQCIHWFNPLVWLAGRAARLDREMACDAWVLARSDADNAGYGATLMKTVQLLSAPLHFSPASITMASGHQNLHARISGIGAFRPTPAWRGVIGIAAMLAALAAVTTSRTPAQEPPKTGQASGIVYPKPPEGGREIVYKEAGELQRSKHALKNVPIDDVTISRPHRWYVGGLKDLLSGHLLSAATSSTWRYILLHGTDVVGMATLMDANAKTGSPLQFTGLYVAGGEKETLEALRVAEKLPQIKKQAYEMRFLSINPLLFHAVWLHGKSDDILIPLPPTWGRKMNAYQPYSADEITKILTPEAERKLNTPGRSFD